jgi:hypothetical protein
LGRAWDARQQKAAEKAETKAAEVAAKVALQAEQAEQAQSKLHAKLLSLLGEFTIKWRYAYREWDLGRDGEAEAESSRLFAEITTAQKSLIDLTYKQITTEQSALHNLQTKMEDTFENISGRDIRKKSDLGHPRIEPSYDDLLGSISKREEELRAMNTPEKLARYEQEAPARVAAEKAAQEAVARAEAVQDAEWEAQAPARAAEAQAHREAIERATEAKAQREEADRAAQARAQQERADQAAEEARGRQYRKEIADRAAKAHAVENAPRVRQIVEQLRAGKDPSFAEELAELATCIDMNRPIAQIARDPKWHEESYTRTVDLRLPYGHGETERVTYHHVPLEYFGKISDNLTYAHRPRTPSKPAPSRSHDRGYDPKPGR